MASSGSDKRAIWSWSLYDFGNSAFTTLVVTFIYSTYFTGYIAKPSVENVIGAQQWSTAIVISALVIAILSPLMGAFADRGGYRKAFCLGFTVIGVAATAWLFFPLPYDASVAATGGSQVFRALAIFVIANVAFEMGQVFYNAFLPDIAPKDKIGRISGYGWALGYLGGLICLAVALFGFVGLGEGDPWFAISKEAGQHVRATNLLVAAWFALFSIPLFLFVKEKRNPATAPSGSDKGIVAATFGQVAATFREIRKYGQIVRFLIARVFYNDGLVTIFAFGGIYAQGTFGFTTDKVILFGIALNVTAGLGSFLFGYLDDKLGGKRTIMFSLFGLIAATLLAVFAPSEAFFWAAGLLLGIFVGPNQSASRSLLARFVPPDKENEFFGFFAMSGKVTAFIGPLLFGWAATAFATQRAGVAVVMVLFALGLIILLRVNEAEGIRVAGRAATS